MKPCCSAFTHGMGFMFGLGFEYGLDPENHDHFDGCGHSGEGVEEAFIFGWREGRKHSASGEHTAEERQAEPEAAYRKGEESR